MNKSKGFTIIELIVVIAIIAILAATVLVSMSGYIAKARDSSMKQAMHNLVIDATAAAFATGTSSYATAITAGVCTVAGNKQYSAIYTGAGGATAGNVVCFANDGLDGLAVAGANFCACFRETADTTMYYCQDSTGVTKETTSTCTAECTAAKGTCT